MLPIVYKNMRIAKLGLLCLYKMHSKTNNLVLTIFFVAIFV